MKELASLAFLAIIGCGTNYNATDKNMTKNLDPVPYGETITESELKTHLYTYASDEFEGRDTGASGQKKAVAYLRDEYKKLNIPAAKADGNYFQNVPLQKGASLKSELTINGKAYTFEEQFLTFTPNNKDVKNIGEIAYIGYGIDDEKYSDYKGKDLEGKVLLIKVGEPKNADGTYFISGTKEASEWSSSLIKEISMKRNAAKTHKAKGLFFFVDKNYPRFKQAFPSMTSNNSMTLQKDNSDDFFYYYINSDVATALHPTIAKDVHATTIPVNIKLTIADKINEINSENVAAIIKGNEKPEEYIVISAHLDHEGIKNGEIYNGADDDGSGTVAILEIAEAFKKAKAEGNGPKRSIVFLHVTGEEKGLLGSRYYTDYDPIFPLENTVTNLNIDMIGRIDPKHQEGNHNYLYLIGSDRLSTELHEVSEAVNKKYTNIELDYTFNDENDRNRYYYRSDHYNFAKNNIPVIFYFNGTHEDYHRPTDTVEKISYDLLTNRARLVFYTAWELANREHKVVVDKATETK